MADTNYQAHVYRAKGSTSMVVASGGSIEVESGGETNLQSGANMKLTAGAVVALGTSTHISSTGKVFVPFGFGLPVETLTSGQGSAHAKTLQAGSCIHVFNISTAVEWFKMPAPAVGDVKYLYNLGASTQVIVESTNTATHVWNSTGGNRIRFEYTSAGAVLVAQTSTSWRLVAGDTSTGTTPVVDVSTST